MEAFLDSQISAIDKIGKVRFGALFMDAGTGKTRSAVELIKSTDADYILWLTPFQTKESLSVEIKRWGGLKCDIVGIESVQNSDRLYLELLTKCQNAHKPFIVVDESILIKNADAKRTKRLIEIGQYSEYKLVLNGTPLSRNLLDLWSQMYFLSPKILNMDMAEFKNTFCEYTKVTYHSTNSYKSYSKEFIKKYHNIDYLYSIIEPFIFESKLSLSIGQQHIDLKYNLSDEEKEEHNRLKEKFLDDKVMQAMNNNIFLEITQKMQHNYSLSNDKFKIVDELIKCLDKSKVIIYAKYVDTQEVLKKYYPDIKIMSIQKHARGLNLQDFNTIIFWDKTWDYAQREQIERRVFRTGQQYDCVYYDLTGNIGLDLMINENVAKKRDLLNIFSKMSNKQLKEKL